MLLSLFVCLLKKKKRESPKGVPTTVLLLLLLLCKERLNVQHIRPLEDESTQAGRLEDVILREGRMGSGQKGPPNLVEIKKISLKKINEMRSPWADS